jgi:predicted CXXCH cytochrome family protein
VGAAMLLAAVGSAQTQAGAPAPTKKSADYVGSETCVMCHEPKLKEFMLGPHKVVEVPKPKVEIPPKPRDEKLEWGAYACEACHGSGKKHAESPSRGNIIQPAKLNPDDVGPICGKCHEIIAAHSGIVTSGHPWIQMKCTDCHSIHRDSNKNEQEGILYARTPEKINRLCSRCHADVWASFQKPFRHRLPEGAMSCADCHQAPSLRQALEGSPDVPPQIATMSTPIQKNKAELKKELKKELEPERKKKLEEELRKELELERVKKLEGERKKRFRPIQTTRFNEPNCGKCHGDKVGPFPFEHAPVRLEGCGTCHQPHGSANPRMLIRHEVRFVCMECHSNLPVPTPAANSTLGTVGPAIHDLRSPRFQNCTLCHQKVHGSYANRALTK